MVLTGWELERRYVYCLLYCLNSGKSIDTYTTATPPLDEDEKVELIGAIGVDIATEAALNDAAKALTLATVKLTEAHLAAGAITVPAPSAGQYDALQLDLNRVSFYVARDNSMKALSGFFAEAAKAIHGLNQA